MCGCCSGSRCVICKILGGLAAAVFALLTVASFMAVWRTHVMPDGWVFGTVEGNTAILALVLSVVCLKKTFLKMCPCGSKSACGGGSCSSGCGDAGCSACPRCGKSPCACMATKGMGMKK